MPVRNDNRLGWFVNEWNLFFLDKKINLTLLTAIETKNFTAIHVSIKKKENESQAKMSKVATPKTQHNGAAKEAEKCNQVENRLQTARFFFRISSFVLGCE